MTKRLLAFLLALLLAGSTAGSTLAIQDSEERPLPFPPPMCRFLIERGAPFELVRLGGPDTDEVCIIIIGGAPGR